MATSFEKSVKACLLLQLCEAFSGKDMNCGMVEQLEKLEVLSY